MNKKLQNALAWRGEPLFNIANRKGTPTINFVVSDQNLGQS